MTAFKEYNVGILGFGFMGKTHTYCHVTLPYFYDSLPFRSKLKAVCTSRRETADKAAKEYGFERAVTDSAEIIHDPEIDIIHICTPNNLHKNELLASMETGKAIYCEKPLTPNYQQAGDVAKALENYQGIGQMTLNYRFFPATMRAKQLMDEGFVGEPVCFRAAFLHSGSIDPGKPLEWKLNADNGGGVLNDLAVHIVDLMQFLLGNFDSVMCTSRILFPERPVSEGSDEKVPVNAEDHACLTLKNDSGLLGTIEASKVATGAQDELRFEIHGTEGAMAFNLMDPNWLKIYDLNAEPEPIGGKRGFTAVECLQRYPAPGGSFPSSKTSIGWVRSHVACLYNFMSAVHEERPTEPGLHTGIELTRFLDAARESETQGAFVDIR